MAQMIALIIFVVLLLSAFFGAMTMYMANQKGLSTKMGLILGATTWFFGLLFIMIKPKSDAALTKEMYDRDLLTKEEYEHTMEVKVKR